MTPHETIEGEVNFISAKFGFLYITQPFLGDAREESELLTWILYQMKEDTIENINRDLLMKMIGDYEYLAVFFCKYQQEMICACVSYFSCLFLSTPPWAKSFLIPLEKYFPGKIYFAI